MIQVLAFCTLIGIAWYVLIARPQRAHQQEHQSMLSSLKIGDYVMTVAGVFGIVREMSGGSVLLEVAPGVTSHVATDGIARIVPGPAPQMQAAPEPVVAQPVAVPVQAAPAPVPVQPYIPAPVQQPYQPAPVQMRYQQQPGFNVQPYPGHAATQPPAPYAPPVDEPVAPVEAEPQRQSPSFFRAQPIDPELASRAKNELVALADEFRQNIGPLVTVEPVPQQPVAHTAPTASTVPLFSSQRSAPKGTGNVPAPQVVFPEAVRPPTSGLGMPRHQPAPPPQLAPAPSLGAQPPVPTPSLLGEWKPALTNGFSLDVPYSAPKTASLWDEPASSSVPA
jgi:preprotein translocase YajC subunit